MSDPSLGVRVSGPLAVHVDGFARDLAALGYADATVRDQLRLMAHLSRWLGSSAVEPGDLTAELVDEFLRARRLAGSTRRGSRRALDRLLDYLRRLEVAPVPHATAVPGPAAAVLAAYHSYLVRERGLAPTTVHRYEDIAREVLAWAMDNGNGLGDLTTARVTRFVLDQCRRQNVGSAKNLLTTLRSLLRFLYLEGHTATPLGSAVPSLAGWRGRSVPRAIDHEQVALLLDSCPRATPAGRRDYAILTLLVRLGLRASQLYLHADLSLKERALAQTTPPNVTPGRYRAPDSLLAFLERL